MLLPKGQVIHENLNTTFTQFDALRDDLKANQFTGYVRVTGWEYEGILLFDTGNVVSAFDETKEGRRGGPIAAERIAAKAREKDGAISVYRQSDQMTQVLAGLFNGEPVYKDLSSDFTSLEKLITKLCGERHTGYVEVQLPGNRDAAIIFMRDGETVESLFSDREQIVSGPNAMALITQATLGASALFTVYRTDLAQAYHQGASLTDSFSRRETFALWQDVLATVEAGVDKTAKPGTLVTALKRACVARADAFPFLDPFVGEFEYGNGKIQFEGRAPLGQFNQGLCDCLAQAIGDLTGVQLNESALLRNLAPGLNELKAKYGARLGQVGLTAALPQLFGA